MAGADAPLSIGCGGPQPLAGKQGRRLPLPDSGL